MDYKKEALDSLAAAWSDGPRDGSYFLVEAQVHAALEQAEQQRITNLIAFMALDTFKAKMIRAEVHEALGLSG